MKKQPGFTVIELLLTIGFVSLLSAFATINLLRPQTKSSLDTTLNTLVADIKQQQIKAMVGDSEGAATNQQFGVYFEANSYILFRGASYLPGNPNNFVVNLDSTINLNNITFPSNTLIFSKRSGEVVGYVTNSDSLIVTSTISSEQKTITINRYGVITIN